MQGQVIFIFQMIWERMIHSYYNYQLCISWDDLNALFENLLVPKSWLMMAKDIEQRLLTLTSWFIAYCLRRTSKDDNISFA